MPRRRRGFYGWHPNDQGTKYHMYWPAQGVSVINKSLCGRIYEDRPFFPAIPFVDECCVKCVNRLAALQRAGWIPEGVGGFRLG
jgi:hypothetical protein